MAARFPMAVVVTGSPLTVTIEGASAVVAAEDFVGGLETGDRVQAAFLGDRLTALAKAGGVAIPPSTRSSTDYLWANSTDRTTQTGMVAGQTGYQSDTGVTYRRSSSAWAVSAPSTNIQTDTTNSVANVITQAGKGKIIGNGTASIQETVTFPVAFTGVPVVVANFMGFRPSGSYNDVGLNLASQNVPAAAQIPSTSGFTAGIGASGGPPLSAASDWYYSWIAIGV